jgi:hypothetical protein
MYKTNARRVLKSDVKAQVGPLGLIWQAGFPVVSWAGKPRANLPWANVPGSLEDHRARFLVVKKKKKPGSLRFVPDPRGHGWSRAKKCSRASSIAQTSQNPKDIPVKNS